MRSGKCTQGKDHNGGVCTCLPSTEQRNGTTVKVDRRQDEPKPTKP